MTLERLQELSTETCPLGVGMASQSDRLEMDEILELAISSYALQAENAKLRGALQYIVDHADFAEKPKWGNEFVDVAKQALEEKRGTET